MVGQRPPDSTRSALQPVKKALIGDELLSNTNEDVKVSAVTCITELFRITAPQPPYDNDKQMKESLQHTVMVLKKLSDVSGRNYYRVVHILETVAKLRSCVLLLDLGYDTLVIEIFKIFLRTIRPYHPDDVFTKMEEIMTQLIQESDELSLELVCPLLDSVTNKNQIASPISSKLGEQVLEVCASIVKPYLPEALKSMGLNLEDFHEIVASICNEIPKGEEMDSKSPRTIKDYGEELVGAGSKSPLDDKFDEAAVSSFDPVKKKHEVKYVDGEVEILSLHKERREMLEDNSSQKDHGIDFQGHAVSLVTESDTTPPLKTYFRRKHKRGDKDLGSLGPNPTSSNL